MQITILSNIRTSAASRAATRLAALAFTMGCSLLLVACQTTVPGNTSSSTPSTGTSSARVPFLNEDGQEGYQTFRNWPGNRAFFVSASGSWGWRSSISKSKERMHNIAYWNCQSKSNEECHLYADRTGIVFTADLETAIKPIPVSELPVHLHRPPGWHRDYHAKDNVLIGPRSFSFVTAIGEGLKGNKAGMHAFLKVRQTGHAIDDWRRIYEDRLIRREAKGEGFSIIDREIVPVTLSEGIQAAAHHLSFSTGGETGYLTSLTFETGGFQYLLTLRIVLEPDAPRRFLREQIIPALLSNPIS